MDFDIKKPSHILAFFILIISFILIFVLPVMTFFVMQDMPQLLEQVNISESVAIQSQLIIIAVFIFVPFSWYALVNKLNFKGILSRIKLVKNNIDKAFLWGIFAAITIFVFIFVIEILLIYFLNYNPKDLSNIPDIQRLFSPITLFFIVGIQPIGEEIFFRGFLFEKIEGYGGGLLSIIITSILFGIAHMSYGKIFPALMPIVMGLILGYIVYRTKNLYSAIIAHVTFNLSSLTLAYIGQELLNEISLIL
jgi:membrane protease YdiL (CAAX protease family)